MKITFAKFVYDSETGKITDDKGAFVIAYDDKAKSLLSPSFVRKIEKFGYYYNFLQDFFDWEAKETVFVKWREIKKYLMDLGNLTESAYKTASLKQLMKQHGLKHAFFRGATWYELPPKKRKAPK